MGAAIALFTPICHACVVLSIQRLGMIPIAVQTIKPKESAACLLRGRWENASRAFRFDCIAQIRRQCELAPMSREYFTTQRCRSLLDAKMWGTRWFEDAERQKGNAVYIRRSSKIFNNVCKRFMCSSCRTSNHIARKSGANWSRVSCKDTSFLLSCL